MPFTFSHPAAVLPSKYLPERWFSLTALVIGSMTPDFEYFIRMRILSSYSHSLLGLFWFDLPLGLLLLFIYNKFIKDKLIDHLPLYLNKRFSSFKNSPKQTKHSIAVIICSVLIGAATHIFWDSFSHPAGYFVRHIHALSNYVVIDHHLFRVYNLVQQASSIIGGLIVIIAMASLPAGEATRSKHIFNYWALVTFTAVLTLTIRIMSGLNTYQTGSITASFIAGLMIGLILASVLVPKNETVLPG